MFQIKEEIEDKGLQYPSYYTVPFHGGRWGGAGRHLVEGLACLEHDSCELPQRKPECTDSILFYYLRPAGYDDGNLNWRAAFEVEPAGDVVALRVWKNEELTPLQAQVCAGAGLAIRACACTHPSMLLCRPG